jgi:hypothetical protein
MRELVWQTTASGRAQHRNQASKRTQGKFARLLFDLDGLKQFNDRHGHWVEAKSSDTGVRGRQKGWPSNESIWPRTPKFTRSGCQISAHFAAPGFDTIE